MKNYNFKKVLLLLVIANINLLATTWADVKVKDPLFPKEECSVQAPMSYGSYIYQYPSKYELIFWPRTEISGIWFCKKSGFTAFIQDFEGLSKKEIKDIKLYLKLNPPKDNSNKTQIKLLEEIYNLRNLNDDVKNTLLRTLAYWYQSFENFEKADSYRQLALNNIKQQLKEELSELKRLEYLYIATNYSKQLGFQKESDDYLNQLKNNFTNIKKDESKNFKEYINEFIDDSKYIIKGKKLEPILPKK